MRLPNHFKETLQQKNQPVLQRRFPATVPKNSAGVRGNIFLTAVFFVFVSYLGFALLSFSLLHTKIRAARTTKRAQTGRMAGELVYYLHHFRETIFKEDLQRFPNPGTDYFNDLTFPRRESANDKDIIITPAFQHLVFPRSGYQRIEIMAAVETSSPRNNFRYHGEVQVEVLSGNIPVISMPLFIDKDVGEPVETYLERNKVINSSKKNAVVKGIDTHIEGTAFLLDSLKIAGTALSWHSMRERFGLEISDQPIEPGLYRVVENETITCIFIQGDVRQLVFSTFEGKQIIGVHLGDVLHGNDHEFRYLPGQKEFSGWDASPGEALFFDQRVVVNGNIKSLRQDGDFAFASESALTLYVSGNVNIDTSLQKEKTNLDNIHLKTLPSTGLTLVCEFEKRFTSATAPAPVVEQPVVTVAGKAVETGKGITLEMSIISGGKVVNDVSDTRINGSVACKELENHGTMEVTGTAPGTVILPSLLFFRSGDFCYINNFTITAMEEAANEEN